MYNISQHKPTYSATGPPNSSLRLTNFFRGPVMKLSKSSTDSGNGSGKGVGGVFAEGAETGGVETAAATDGRAVPFVFGSSIADDAISSSREVAASSLWMRDVSASLGIVGTTLLSMIAVCPKI